MDTSKTSPKTASPPGSEKPPAQPSNKTSRALDAIIFDMGDVFYDATTWRKWLTGFLRNRGVEITYPALCRGWEHHLVPVYRGQGRYWDAFRAFLRSLALTAEQIEVVVAAARAKSQSPEVKNRQLLDGVGDTLHDLCRLGVKLGVLSDTESSAPTIRKRLARWDIDELFSAVVSSSDIGFVKPQAEAYERALAPLGARKDRAAFVGHDEEELQGALDCGLTAIAFNFDPNVPATHKIWHFSELYRLAAGRTLSF